METTLFDYIIVGAGSVGGVPCSRCRQRPGANPKDVVQ